MTAPPPLKLVIVSGLSGSGKTVALHMLEDLGYYCVDNLPISMLEPMVREIRSDPDRTYDRMAIGVDARARVADMRDFAARIRRLREAGVDCETVALQADNEIILKRYSETRRRHPLSDANTPLAEAIDREREILEPLTQQADLVIDTTRTTMHQLRDLVRDRIHGRGGLMSVLIESFGYKHGLPPDADFVFDLRCLPNPHWIPDLRGLTGLDPPVVDYLAASRIAQDLRQDIQRFLERWLPAFETDNRSYLTVALGCTGGQHRSVWMAEQLAAHFDDGHRQVLIRHTELS